jgi:hypothetical protein
LRQSDLESRLITPNGGRVLGGGCATALFGTRKSMRRLSIKFVD